jgi:hypothetical protein
VHSSQVLKNHVTLVLDRSASMREGGKDKRLPKVVDDLIRDIATTSTAMNQETRVSVVLFGATVETVIFDVDVLRLPSIAEVYLANEGSTRLLDATENALNEQLGLLTQKYGDHAFLFYVVTDGEENASRNHGAYNRRANARALSEKLLHLPENVTVAALVPDERGIREAEQYGFPRDNIATWDADTAQGVEDAVSTIRTATQSYMTSRASGQRGTRKLFGTIGADVDTKAVQAADLVPLPTIAYQTFTVPVTGHEDDKGRYYSIKDYLTNVGGGYERGSAFYQLTKKETIQPQKELVLRRKTGPNKGEVFHGPNTRQLLGLPDYHVVIKVADNPDWDFFVQSTSYTRKLVGDTDLIVLRRQ